MKPKLVIINWEDAITPTSGWTNINDIDNDLADCISIGLIIEENDKTITLVSHISGSDTQVDIDGSLVLDKSWIKYRKDLPLPKETINKLKKWLLENVDAQKNR
jgi:hypothetical protein